MKILSKLFIWAVLLGYYPGVKNAEAKGRSPASSTANYFKHELLFNYSESGLETLSFGPSTTLALGVGYHYSILPFLQVGGKFGLVYKSLDAVSTTAFGFLVGPTLDFPFDWRLENAFFGSVFFGVEHASLNGITTTPFVVNFDLGKRFSVIPQLSFRPSVGVFIPTSGRVGVKFSLLVLSLFF